MLRIFTLKFQSTLGAFDDTELQAFIKDKEVVSIRDHFFTKDDMPYLTVLVTYQLAGPPTDVPTAESASTTPRNEKWREILEEAATGPCSIPCGSGATGSPMKKGCRPM